MKQLILLLIMLLPAGIFAQLEMRKSSLAPVGGSVISGHNYMVHAGGEVVNREMVNGDTRISEGFIGPDFSHFLHVEDYAHLDGVNIYPNPVSDYLQIGLPAGSRYEVYLFAINGKEIYRDETGASRYNMDMRSLAPGIYLLVIIDRQHRSYVSYKIQKQ